MHIHKNPLLLGTLPAALEDGLDVFIPMVASQGKRSRRKLSWCIGQDNNSTRKGYYPEGFPVSSRTAL
jgi:hypothetical protein